MRSTLLPVALALVCLSATFSGAHAAAPKAAAMPHLTMLRDAYACFDAETTESVYQLFGRDDAASKRRIDALMAEARHADPRLCRFFDKAKPVKEILPDDGTDYTCVTDSTGPSSDKICYWVRSMDLLIH